MSTRPIVVIDTETTGPNPFIHDLISLALVPLDRGMQALEVNVRVSDSARWTRFSKENFERFKKRWSETAMEPDAAARAVQAYINSISENGSIILAGHNIGFDRAFLQKLAFIGGLEEFEGISHRNLDTHSMILDRVLSGSAPEAAVTSSGAFNFYKINLEKSVRHTALGDALATRELIEKLLNIK